MIKEFSGTLSLNNHLDNTEHLYEGRLSGPECLRKRGNDIYATVPGRLVKINGEHITHVASFGKACGKFFRVWIIKILKFSKIFDLFYRKS